MAEAKTYYVCKMEIYAGKQPDGPFKVNDSSINVVTRLISKISGSGRNVTFDYWYTTYLFIRSVLDKHKLTVVETLRKNKREIPLEFLDVEKRDRHSSMFGFSNKITLVSNVSDSKKRNAVFFSSMHLDDKIDSSSGDDKKPDIITFYNTTKGGVGMVDQMAGDYDTSTRNSRRWPITAFYFL